MNSFIKFKHFINGEVVEIYMQPNQSMRFAYSDRTEFVTTEESEVVFRTNFGYYHREMRCSVDKLASRALAEGNFPAWEEIPPNPNKLQGH